MDDVDLTVVLQRAADNQAALIAAAQQTYAPPPPPTHDDVLPLAPGNVVVDSQTGQVVEVVSGQRSDAVI